MGVIDDHRKIPAGWHDLHPSLDPAAADNASSTPVKGHPRARAQTPAARALYTENSPGIERLTRPDHAVPYQFEAHAARTVTNVFGTVVAVVRRVEKVKFSPAEAARICSAAGSSRLTMERSQA